jgi:hypothetical protein
VYRVSPSPFERRPQQGSLPRCWGRIRAASRELLTAGKSKAARIAITKMTTRSSSRVKALAGQVGDIAMVLLLPERRMATLARGSPSNQGSHSRSSIQAVCAARVDGSWAGHADTAGTFGAEILGWRYMASDSSKSARVGWDPVATAASLRRVSIFLCDRSLALDHCPQRCARKKPFWSGFSRCPSTGSPPANRLLLAFAPT